MITLPTMRQKLVAIVMVTTMSALLVTIAAIVGFDLRNYHRALLLDMATQAELLGHMTAAALTFDDRRLAGENLSLLRIRPTVRSGAIYKANGALFSSYLAPGETSAIPVRAELDNVRRDGADLVIYRRIIEHDEFIGTVYLRARYNLFQRGLDALLIGAAVMTLAMLVAYLLTRRLGRIITAPILAVTAVAREVVATRDYSRRAPRTSNDEAAELADSFNAMLTEIEQRTGALENSNREIAREAEQRASAQREVMRLNEQLEARVHERTMALELANAELGLAIEAARNANQAKSAFLSAMSHELRTPLNAILGFAQILTSTSMPTTLEQKKEFAGHILKSGRHLLTLINEILDLAKVESGAVTLSIEPVGLDDILPECRDMVAPMASQRGIRILFPEACQLTVRADRTRLKQVILNLLSNAIKYNREGGAVLFECEAVGVDTVRLSVRDTGYGLRPDQIAALFQPFNRLGQENGVEEGTGIGLVVTRRMVELMGGQVGVASSVGVGTVFWIELKLTAPLASLPSLPSLPPPSTAAVAAPPSPLPAARAGHLLLYVEDNPANLKLVEEIVRYRPDLRLMSALDGHLGLTLAKAHLPDLILMDLNLPCVSGTDALAELRKDPCTAAIPVIALTANAMPRDVERGLASGFFRYLTKPINIDEFTEAIDSTLTYIEQARAGRKAGEF
jgi:signal transduction histidine kinase/ActR/RegA family two-component response regulator